MKKVSPCAVCEEMTSGFLFNDKMLGVPICSKKCEHEYLNTLTTNMKEHMDTLRVIDYKMEKVKQYKKIGWMIASFGALLIAIGFLAKNATVFLAGIFPLTCGALSTSYFEDKRNKLIRLRKRIVI